MPVLTESLFGASEASLDSVLEPEAVVPNLRAGRELRAAPQATQGRNHPQVQDGWRPDFRNLPMDNGQNCCGKALEVLRQPPF